jgi:hypothetical protein
MDKDYNDSSLDKGQNDSLMDKDYNDSSLDKGHDDSIVDKNHYCHICLNRLVSSYIKEIVPKRWLFVKMLG